MTTDSWIQLDDQRVVWLFLILGRQAEIEPDSNTSNQNEGSLIYWEIGVGHSESLIKTTAKRIDRGRATNESKLIELLFAELDQYRYNDNTIITLDSRTIPRLRRRVIKSATNSSPPSLRGFTHLDIQTVLSEHFEQDISEYGIDRESRTPPHQTETALNQVVSTGSLRDLSSVWNRIFRLVPASDLTGQRL